MRPKISIIFPSIADYDGVYFSAFNIKEHNDLSQCEILIGDGMPGHKDSAALRALCNWSSPTQNHRGAFSEGNMGCRYIDTSKCDGTAATKELLIQEAQGEWIYIADGHTGHKYNVIDRAMELIEREPDSKDLYVGPVVFDNNVTATHFDNMWRGEMWGIWASAWQAPCEDGDIISLREQNGRVVFWSMGMDPVPLKSSATCGITYPDIPFANHEQPMRDLGYKQLGVDPDLDIEVPGHGCGMMFFRKEAWPGFNPAFRGFGGEEMYIHEKFRRNGGRVRCLGFFRWFHRWYKPNGIPYRLNQWDKARNYVVGLEELGMDIEPVHDLFVLGDVGKLTEFHWEKLREPMKYVREPVAPTPSATEMPPVNSILDIFVTIKGIKRDLNEHMDRLFELANNCLHVTEFSHRRESLIALAMAAEANIISYNTEGNDPAVGKVSGLRGNMWIETKNSAELTHIAKTDMLFIDQEHTYERVNGELEKFHESVSHYIVLHDTTLYAKKGEDGGAGLSSAILDFIQKHPNWFVLSHTDKQHGLTVLSCHEAERPETTIVPWAPEFGPGSKLKEIMASLGIHATASCSCNRLAASMNTWGVANCRERRSYLIGEIEKNYHNWGWRDKLQLVAAGGRVLAGKLPFKIDPFDIVGSFVDGAINLAEEEENAKRGAL